MKQRILLTMNDSKQMWREGLGLKAKAPQVLQIAHARMTPSEMLEGAPHKRLRYAI